MPLDLRPIDETNQNQAVALLVEGFRTRTPEQWRRIMALSRAHDAPESDWPAGFLLHAKSEAVGVLLTAASVRRDDAGAARTVVNLHSWYIRDSHRLLARKMLQVVTGHAPAFFTDVSPIPAVQVLNETVGFRTSTTGARLVPLATGALLPSGGARVRKVEAAVGLADDDCRILADHAALGCVTGVLISGEGTHPLIFARTGRRGFPGLRLVYGPPIDVLSRHAGATSRFLLGQPALYWSVPGNEDDRLAGSLYWKRTAPCQVLGEVPGAAIDHAYSELVYARALEDVH